MVWPMLVGLTQLIRSLALMMLIKNLGRHNRGSYIFDKIEKSIKIKNVA
jgi:hypothetical protein